MYDLLVFILYLHIIFHTGFFVYIHISAYMQNKDNDKGTTQKLQTAGQICP